MRIDDTMTSPKFYSNLTHFSISSSSSPMEYFDQEKIPYEDYEYCGSTVDTFAQFYYTIDVYVATLVCVTGCLTNILNMWILTRRNMSSSPTNKMFTMLALTDFLCVLRKLERLIVNWYFYQVPSELAPGGPRHFPTVGLVVYDLVNIILFVLFHTWSIYLTLTVGLWRYLGMLYVFKSRQWFTMRRARWAILISLVTSTLLIPPMCLGLHIQKFNASSQSPSIITNGNYANGGWNGSILAANFSQTEQFEWVQDEFGRVLLFCILTIFIKVGPCIVMFIITVGLICCLSSATKNRTKLLRSGVTSSGSVGAASIELSVISTSSHEDYEDRTMKKKVVRAKRFLENQEKRPSVANSMQENSDATSRTNRMLIVVLIIFLATEFPPGLMSVLSIVLGHKFYEECQFPLLLFLNLLEYVSSTTSFFVYLLMSQKFRKNFVKIFVRRK